MLNVAFPTISKKSRDRSAETIAVRPYESFTTAMPKTYKKSPQTRYEEMSKPSHRHRHVSGPRGDPSNSGRRRPRRRASHGKQAGHLAASPSPARLPRAQGRGMPVPTPPGAPGRGGNCSTAGRETAEAPPLQLLSPLRMRPAPLTASTTLPPHVQGPLDIPPTAPPRVRMRMRRRFGRPQLRPHHAFGPL